MNIANFDAEKHIDFNAVQTQVEDGVNEYFEADYLHEHYLHNVVIGCVCNGGHCTKLAKTIGMRKKSHTNILKKIRKQYKNEKLKQTLYWKKKTSMKFPIVIPE